MEILFEKRNSHSFALMSMGLNSGREVDKVFSTISEKIMVVNGGAFSRDIVSFTPRVKLFWGAGIVELDSSSSCSLVEVAVKESYGELKVLFKDEISLIFLVVDLEDEKEIAATMMVIEMFHEMDIVVVLFCCYSKNGAVSNQEMSIRLQRFINQSDSSIVTPIESAGSSISHIMDSIEVCLENTGVINVDMADIVTLFRRGSLASIGSVTISLDDFHLNVEYYISTMLRESLEETVTIDNMILDICYGDLKKSDRLIEVIRRVKNRFGATQLLQHGIGENSLLGDKVLVTLFASGIDRYRVYRCSEYIDIYS